MITIKKPEEIVLLREGGKRLAFILRELVAAVRVGGSAKELDVLAHKLATENGNRPAFLNYTPEGVRTPYPASVCISINEEVVHGIPHEGKIFKEGDVVAIDMGLIHGGLFTDSAVTMIVGKGDAKAKKLISSTRKALELGIKAARGGNRVGDIGFAIESFVKPLGFGLAEGLAGHGVGYKVHEDPYVPNTGKSNDGPLLKPGMIIAIEPMLNEGTSAVVFDKDEYTVRTRDGKRSAHFEHTILITEKGAEILTK